MCGTRCRLRAQDFHQVGDETTITLHEKGDKHRRIGLHFAAAEAEKLGDAKMKEALDALRACSKACRTMLQTMGVKVVAACCADEKCCEK